MFHKSVSNQIQHSLEDLILHSKKICVKKLLPEREVGEHCISTMLLRKFKVILNDQDTYICIYHLDQEEGDICIHMVDSCCCMAEINITL